MTSVYSAASENASVPRATAEAPMVALPGDMMPVCL